jgi:hypothetical protein
VFGEKEHQGTGHITKEKEEMASSSSHKIDELTQRWEDKKLRPLIKTQAFEDIKASLDNSTEPSAPYPWLQNLLAEHVQAYVYANEQWLSLSYSAIQSLPNTKHGHDGLGFIRYFRHQMPFAKQEQALHDTVPLIRHNYKYSAYRAAVVLEGGTDVDPVHESKAIFFDQGYRDTCVHVFELAEIWNALFQMLQRDKHEPMFQALAAQHITPGCSATDQTSLALYLVHIFRAEVLEHKLRTAGEDLLQQRRGLASLLMAKFPQLFDVLVNENSAGNCLAVRAEANWHFACSELFLGMAWIMPRVLYFLFREQCTLHHEPNIPVVFQASQTLALGFVHARHIYLESAYGQDLTFQNVVSKLHAVFLIWEAARGWSPILTGEQYFIDPILSLATQNYNSTYVLAPALLLVVAHFAGFLRLGMQWSRMGLDVLAMLAVASATFIQFKYLNEFQPMQHIVFDASTVPDAPQGPGQFEFFLSVLIGKDWARATVGGSQQSAVNTLVQRNYTQIVQRMHANATNMQVLSTFTLARLTARANAHWFPEIAIQVATAYEEKNELSNFLKSTLANISNVSSTTSPAFSYEGVLRLHQTLQPLFV